MKIRLLIILTFLQCLQADLVFGQLLNTGNNVKSKFLLNMMINSRQKAKNIQYHVEYIDWDDLSELKKAIERSKSERDKEQLKKLLEERENHNLSYKRHTIVLDDKGGIKIDTESGLFDSSGQKIPGDSLTRSWDNHQSVIYVNKNNFKSAGSAVLDNKEMPFTSRQKHPWRSNTGLFLRDLEEAIQAKETIDVEELPDGTYHVIFNRKNGDKKTGIVDPAKGFSCILNETHRNDHLLFRRTAEYEEFSDGVWFPVTGKDTKFSSEGVEIYKSTMKVGGTKINDPDFHEGLFHIDLPRGTSVFDRVSGLSYVVGDPMSATLRMGSAVSLDQIAQDTLEEIAKEEEQKHEEVEIFIPKISITPEKRTIFILDLSDRELISAPGKPNSEKAHKYLTKIGEGDIAWDGTVVAIRGASVLTTKQESNRPLTFTKGKWSRSYKLPDKVELPYSVLIVTKEETNYLMTVRKVESGGIRVTYRQLYPDNLSRYKQKSKDK